MNGMRTTDDGRVKSYFLLAFQPISAALSGSCQAKIETSLFIGRHLHVCLPISSVNMRYGVYTAKRRATELCSGDSKLSKDS